MIVELGGTPSSSPTPWSDFFSVEPYLGRTRDWIENFLLPLPGGILAGLAFKPNKKVASWLLVWCFPLFFTAFGMEVCQHWLQDRNASFWDALLMSSGIVSGIIIGWQTQSVFSCRSALTSVNGIFLLWMVSAFIPAELQLAEADFYQALNVLAATKEISINGVLWATGCWLIAAYFSPWQTNRALIVSIFLVTILGIITPQRAVLPELIMGGGTAEIVLASYQASRLSRLTLTFSLAVVAIGLEFTGTVAMHSQMPLFRFPLLTDLSGSRWLTLISASIEDYFLFLSLPWVIAGLAADFKSTLRWTVSGGILILVASLLAPLFFSTPWDTLGLAIYIANAWIANYWRGFRLDLEPKFMRQAPFDKTHWRFTYHPLIPLCCAIAVISIAMAAIVHLPEVPYNVRELFETRNLVFGVTIFSVFLIWNTAAPGLMAYYLIKHPLLHLFQPLLYLLMATVSWVFLRFAVSAESLHDILGAPVWNWPSDWELYLRYLAFAYPFLWSLFGWNLFFQLQKQHQLLVSLILWTLAIVIGMPLLIAAKFLIIDRAATDNVVELISSIPALFALILLIAWNGVFVGQRRHLALVVLVTAISAALSCILLSTAFYTHAISFLLSPDRETLMSGAMLIWRWVLLYLLLVGFIVFGQRLVAPWLKIKVPPKKV
jgi:hypothetical protein